MKMRKEVMDIFNNPEASKVLATVDENGNVNVAPHGSLLAFDEETITFAKSSKGKTWHNLEATKKAAAAAFLLKPKPIGYQIKGAFKGFQTAGLLFDQYKDKAPKGIEVLAVGTIRVEEVYSLV